jgi:hypothetical protein
MAIRSEVFGGVVLTGKDAAAFERQVKREAVPAAAQRTLARGDELLSRFKESERSAAKE